MPPDRGAVKKSPYDKKPSSVSSSRKVNEDVKDVRSKFGSSREKETSKTRDVSSTRSNKEKVQKEEAKTKTSVREKLAVIKSETEKSRLASKDMKDRIKAKESHSTSRISKDTSTKSTKPGLVPGRTAGRNDTRGEAAPRRTQLSYHNAQRADKPKISTSSSVDAKKSSNSSTKPPVRRTEVSRQGTIKRESNRTAKLPDKFTHTQNKEQTRDRGRQTKKVEEPNRLGRDRTLTRTLSPTEVKVARGEPQERIDHNKNKSDLPQNDAAIIPIAGPSTARDQGGGDSPDPGQEDDAYDYEDDFEDYESDFEESSDSETTDEGAYIKHDDISSTDSETESESEPAELTPRTQPVIEEEKKLDSGNYDLAERRRKGRELQEIKKALERENEALSTKKITRSEVMESQNMPDDEGYEEGRISSNKFSSTAAHLSFINFANARKRKQEKMATANAKKRGEQLLGMIKLDIVSFTLFDLPPIPYEVYMKSYGRSNTQQVHVQTNEDNLSEEIQTDEILCKNKWTQAPVSFQTGYQKNDSHSKSHDVILYTQDHLGVGGDSLEEDPDSWKERIKVDTVRLSQFISSAGQVMLVLLEEGESPNASMLNRNQMDIPFSDGYISLGMESVPYLSDIPISYLKFSQQHSTLLLTVHNNVEQEPREYNSIIAVWNTLEPSFPQKILLAPDQITASCFDSATSNLVFAGLDDGSLCVWDMREKSHCHKRDETEKSAWVLRSPTYNTAEILKDKGHLCRIVAIQPLTDVEEKSELSNKAELSPIQICSLDEGGTIITWTVIQSYKPGAIAVQDLGLAHWGRVRLVFSSSFTLKDCSSLDQNLLLNLMCYDLQLDAHDPNHLYIATNMGYVVHSMKNGGKVHPQFYIPNWDAFTVIKCIEVFPFGYPFFLVGCNEGTMRLHCQTSEKPIATFAATGDTIGEGSPIIAIQWSRSKPFIFFVLDNTSRLHVWDLSKTDIYPLYTVPFGTLTAMQLSPDTDDAKIPQKIALSTGPGRVEIHQLKRDYSQSPAEVNIELEKFKRFASIL